MPTRKKRPVPKDSWSVLGYNPNEWSIEEVHRSAARFNYLCTCRQCGKTETASMEIHRALTEKPEDGKPPLVGVVSFDFAHAQQSIDRFLERITRVFGPSYYSMNKNDHVLYVNGTNAELRWFSAENPDSVTGWAFTDLFFDESQAVSDVVFEKARPALSVRDARVFAFGTPDIRPEQSWFRGGWLRGQSDETERYHSFTLSCWDNPWMNLEDILDAQETLSEREFRMLYLGEWVDADGKVFKNVDENVLPRWPKQGETKGPYVIGVDLAKTTDYTVAFVYDAETKLPVDMYRVNQLDYPDVEDALEDLAKRWSAQSVVIEQNGPGVPVSDALARRGVAVRRFVSTNKSKNAAIDGLVRELEHGRLKLPPYEILLKELKEFQREVTAAGNVTYRAPLNFHDDCVIALALTNQALLKTAPVRATSWLNF